MSFLKSAGKNFYNITINKKKKKTTNVIPTQVVNSLRDRGIWREKCVIIVFGFGCINSVFD